MKMKMIFERLLEPFPYEDIEWRVQQSGITKDKPWAMVLAYVTNRAIMNRLDEILGADKWKNKFKKAPEGGVMCGISIKVGDEWITKWDGADNTDIESVKGGLSSSMKRAAVQWGIGRYLYNLETNFVPVYENVREGKYRLKIQNKSYSWDSPDLPDWAIPKKKKQLKKRKLTLKEKALKIGMPDDKKQPNTPKIATENASEGNGIPPKPEEFTDSQLIQAIEKLSQEMIPPDWEKYKQDELGLKHLTELNRDELWKFGKKLKKHIAESQIL